MRLLTEQVIEYLANPGPHKLELGAGENGKSGWLSTDLVEHKNPNGTFTHGLNVTKPFPIGDETFDYVYSEHMIEHIDFRSSIFMLKECFRILKAGGVIRIVTPSIEFLLRVLSPNRSIFEQTYVEWSVKNFVPEAFGYTDAFFLNNFMRAWGHRFIFDKKTLYRVLQDAGFGKIIDCKIGLSKHGPLSNLEFQERLPCGFLALESMIIEAQK
jgi:predicted SAM-dependent methyltransferase